jgi:hypothetical protein
MQDVSSEQPRCWMCGKFTIRPGDKSSRILISCDKGHEIVSWLVGPKSPWTNWSAQSQKNLLHEYQLNQFVDHAETHDPCP